MSKEFEVKCPAYPVKAGHSREQDVYFACPDEIDSNTGLMLLISGFGGTPEANVYAKMRKQFADLYNLIVVQSTYLGMEFMGDCNQLNIDGSEIQRLKQVLPIAIKKQVFRSDCQFDFNLLMTLSLPFKTSLQVRANLNETESNFADMGPIQAIDCMRALHLVYGIVKNQGFQINLDKMIVYGYSHGAYLAHLCNVFFPDVFSFVLDNSAWISPVYLEIPRETALLGNNNLILHKFFSYRIATQNYDKQLYDLGYLYKDFNNKANIVIYQGVTDRLIDHRAKEAIFRQVKHVTFNMITVDKVDGLAILSTNHGDMDFVELFNKEAREHSDLFTVKKHNHPFSTSQLIKTDQAIYNFHLVDDVPSMTIKEVK